MNTIATEHLGLSAVHKACAEMNAIWRPTSANDLGIDGQIELLEGSGPVSSGLMLAAQVKSGASYFKKVSSGDVLFYPEARHRQYWARLPAPVLLILHNPDDGVTVYCDVKPQLGSGGPIRVSATSVFDAAARATLGTLAERYHGEVTPERIVERLRRAFLEVGAGRIISGVEFLVASTNLEHGYVELRMARLHTLIEIAQAEEGIHLGSNEYDWILRCTLLCWALRLCERADGEFDYWWYDLKMVPDIAMPLTGIGREVVEYVFAHADRCSEHHALGEPEVGKAGVRLRWLAQECQAASDRLDASDRTGEHDM